MSKFQSLVSLDVSGNRFTRVENSEFMALTSLMYLDLSNNLELEVMEDGSSFNGLEETLIYLGLNNISLNAVSILDSVLRIHNNSLINLVL